MDEIETNIKKLNEQVSQFTTKTNSQFQQFNFTDKINSNLFYLLIPIFIFVIFYVLKPSFVMKEVSIDGNLPVKKLDYKKIFLTTLLLSIIIISGIFIYKHKKEK